jgi:hypothetical protein
MAEENAHVQNLIAARGRQVEERRELAAALAQKYERGEADRLRRGPYRRGQQAATASSRIAFAALRKPGALPKSIFL